MKGFITAGALALGILAPLSAIATVQRTFVASNGNDTFGCTLAQPCRTFAVAIAKTSAAGEVIVLDSAGYGPVKITKSVSIIAPAGVYAGVSVSSGDGITIDGSGIIVVLRGLTINGQGGRYGVYFLHGNQLTIEECEIANMSLDGIGLYADNSIVTVKNTTVRNNGNAGVLAYSTTGVMRVSVSNCVLANNFFGVYSSATLVGATALIVTRSTLVGIASDAFFVSAGAGASASALSDGNTITYSKYGFYFGGNGGDERIYTVGNNTAGYVNGPVGGGALTSCCGI